MPKLLTKCKESEKQKKGDRNKLPLTLFLMDLIWSLNIS